MTQIPKTTQRKKAAIWGEAVPEAIQRKKAASQREKRSLLKWKEGHNLQEGMEKSINMPSYGLQRLLRHNLRNYPHLLKYWKKYIKRTHIYLSWTRWPYSIIYLRGLDDQAEEVTGGLSGDQINSTLWAKPYSLGFGQKIEIIALKCSGQYVQPGTTFSFCHSIWFLFKTWPQSYKNHDFVQ